MEQTKNIAYQPTDGLSYDPSEAKYWDPVALEKEIQRTFEICHGCRLCFKYCDSFPSLFSLLDNQYDGEVRRDRKSTRLNSSHTVISYAVFCLKKKKKNLRHYQWSSIVP